jgi:TonB family protein
MATMPRPEPTADRAPTPPGHLSVHIAGDHPEDTLFLFERGRKRAPGAAVASTFAHVLAVALILVGIHRAAAIEAADAARSNSPKAIVWVAREGLGGGGGGGGNRSKEPPKRVELADVHFTEPRPVPVEPARSVEAPPEIALAARDLADGAQPVTGTFDGVPGGIGGGSGSGGGGGTGSGGGIGGGHGDGIGDGWGGGTGGGAYEPGNGVSNPRPIRQVKPVYTAEAMRAKIQGTVVVECVVMADGTVSNARVVKSLDQACGLDGEALKAARQWRFIPGLLRGQPVSVYATIELAFSLR